MIPYKSPEYEEKAFNCPHCGAYAVQRWFDLGNYRNACNDEAPMLDVAFCTHCGGCTLWVESQIAYPTCGTAPLPNQDLPDDVRADYEEARSIASVSPRGAAALLRLAVQKLCKHLGEKGENINVDISKLVKKGLSAKVQKALDYVRINGNNAVHPGQIDLNDDQTIVDNLFKLINLIADAMITQPKHVDALYSGLPQSAKDAIAKRDGTHS